VQRSELCTPAADPSAASLRAAEPPPVEPVRVRLPEQLELPVQQQRSPLREKPLLVLPQSPQPLRPVSQSRVPSALAPQAFRVRLTQVSVLEPPQPSSRRALRPPLLIRQPCLGLPQVLAASPQPLAEPPSQSVEYRQHRQGPWQPQCPLAASRQSQELRVE
jgi:hypothetical protein